MPKSPLLSRILVWILEFRKWYPGIHQRLWRNFVNLKRLYGVVLLKSTDSTPGHDLALKTTKSDLQASTPSGQHIPPSMVIYKSQKERLPEEAATAMSGVAKLDSAHNQTELQP
ncbi:hypothetical protein FRC00_001388, partial [Tulasnella sp. 408]